MEIFTYCKYKLKHCVLFLLCLLGFQLVQAQDFITTWQTTTANETITIPTTGTGYNYSVDWGDGSPVETGFTGNATHTYTTAGTYTVSISGNFPRIFFNQVGDRLKIRTIQQWGNIAWTSMRGAFQGCSNLTYTATDVPNLSAVTDLSYMFNNCTVFNGNIGAWNTSTVTNMFEMFYVAAAFNQDISNWNTSSVTNMGSMFLGATAFNQNISNWERTTPSVSTLANVTNMSYMFYDASAFNQNIGNWNTSAVTNMYGIFAYATAFNQNIGNWNTGTVTTMGAMFGYATAFNQDISNWNVSNVTNMSNMFVGATAFNNAGQPLSNWEKTTPSVSTLANVTNMVSMFYAASAFNQNIGNWNTSAVTNMGGTFAFATAFNQNLGAWNTSAVTNMNGVFLAATAFNRNLGTWNVGNVIDMANMLNSCGMNTANYDATLIGWAAQTLKPNVTLSASGRTYCAGVTARATLTSAPKNWTIIGDNVCQPEIDLRGSGNSITNGDTTPATSDLTDFRATSINTTLSYTFFIHNLGIGPLNISSISNTNTTDFTIAIAPTSIAAGSSSALTINLNATAIVGEKTATITINSNDADENMFSFAIRGEVVNPTPSFVRGNMITFDGVNDYIVTRNTAPVTNNFTVEMWVFPTATHEIDVENLASTQGTTGQRYVLDAQLRSSPDAGMGISVGTNGVSVYEHSGNYLPSLLTWSGTLTGWNHIAVVYTNKQPSLYVNGVLVKTGLTSPRTNVFAPTSSTAIYGIGCGLYGCYAGSIEELRVWSTVRTQAEIRENMHLMLAGTASGLLDYYQFNDNLGTTAVNIARNNHGTLQNGASRSASTLSVAKGISERKTISTATLQTFDNLNINFTAISTPAASDEFVTYQLYETPYNNITGVYSTTSNYWVVRQFGTQTFAYNRMDYTIPSSNTIDATEETGLPGISNLKLHKRNTNSGATWGTEIGTATAASNTTKEISYDINPAQTSFSEFILISSLGSPLPITLVQFNASRINTNEVQLTWTTATEINNKGFEIEQSEDGITYYRIAFIEGRGNSSTIHQYSHTTIQPYSNYYRLKQIDFDGKFSYSPIRYVEGIANKLYFAPNPTTDVLNLIGNIKADEILNLEVIGTNGQILWQGKGKAREVEHSLNLNLKNFKAGLYLFRLQTAGKVSVQKMVKQ